MASASHDDRTDGKPETDPYEDRPIIETEKVRKRASAARGTSSRRRRVSTRRRSVSTGGDLVNRLNGMVAELIRENRSLKRQIERLASTAHTEAITEIDQGIRKIRSRIQRAIDAESSPAGRGRRSSRAAASPSRRQTVRRRRR